MPLFFGAASAAFARYGPDLMPRKNARTPNAPNARTCRAGRWGIASASDTEPWVIAQSALLTVKTSDSMDCLVARAAATAPRRVPNRSIRDAG